MDPFAQLIAEFEARVSVVVEAALEKQLAELLPKLQQQQAKVKEGKYRSRKETADRLGCSLVTLGKWTKEGIIQGHRINSRVRYKDEDIEAALIRIKGVRNVA